MSSLSLSKVYQHKGAVYSVAYYTGHRRGQKQEIELCDKIFQSYDRAEAYMKSKPAGWFVRPFVVQLNLS